jgi:hypothetical protein
MKTTCPWCSSVQDDPGRTDARCRFCGLALFQEGGIQLPRPVIVTPSAHLVAPAVPGVSWKVAGGVAAVFAVMALGLYAACHHANRGHRAVKQLEILVFLEPHFSSGLDSKSWSLAAGIHRPSVPFRIIVLVSMRPSEASALRSAAVNGPNSLPAVVR